MPLKSLIGKEGANEIVGKATAQSESQESEDYTIFGDKATGIVENGEHTFKLGGSIKRVYVEEGATVKVNGEEVTEEELDQIAEGKCIIGPQPVNNGGTNEYTVPSSGEGIYPDMGPTIQEAKTHR